MIGRRVSHYKITEKLGEGGMGTVYLAHDERLDRAVALKFLPAEVGRDPAALSRFRREARSAARLKHANIVTIHAFGEHDGVPFLVMEHVEGETLDQMLRAGPLPAQTACDIAIQVCDGLARAHSAGIVHRDIKPANIVVGTDGHARILDFGVAKLEGATTLTAEASTVGTVTYMSPEQASGRAVDTRSDLFSLGAVVYEMLTGRRPFDADHAAAVTFKVIHESHEPLPAELEQYNSLIARALAKDPGARFQSAAEFGNVLRALSGVAPVALPGARRWWKPIAAVSASVVLILAAVLILKPFEFRIAHPDATAGENKLAVMYFDNMVDPDDPGQQGEMVAELLMTGLSESEHLNVVSSQRLYDLLKLMGKEGEKRIDRTTATEVASRAHARWMMLGRILQTEPNFVVTSQIVDVSTGDVAASQRIMGNAGESLFSLVDRITARTLEDLAVPRSNMSPRPVAEMSTTSEDAYRYYLEGIAYERKWFMREARQRFARALDVDSTFAMAAFHLGIREVLPERRQRLQQAVRHADRASAREKLYLRSADALARYDWQEAATTFDGILEKYPDDKFALEFMVQLGIDPEKGAEYGRRLVELDPLSTMAWLHLSYDYSAMGDLESALVAIDRYIEVAPGEPNPYDTRGDILVRFGRLDDAIEAYQKSVEIKPDFNDCISTIKLGHTYANRGDYAQAEAQYRLLFDSPDAEIRARGRKCLIELQWHRGHCAAALEELEVARRVDRLEGVTGWDGIRAYDKVLVLIDTGQTERALDAFNEWAGPENSGLWARMNGSYLLATMRRGDEAEQYLGAPLAGERTLTSHERFVYDMQAARVAAARGNYNDAIARYNALWDHATRTHDPFWYYRFCFDFAEVCFEAGRWNDVIRVVEDAFTGYPYSISRGVRNARFHYFLGVAYQEIGRSDDAIEQLEKLLTIWADADPQLVGLEDARERLATLKAGS